MANTAAPSLETWPPQDTTSAENAWKFTPTDFVAIVHSLSRVRLFATPWTLAHQAPLSMGFSRQEHWSGLPFLPPGDLPDPVIELESWALQTDSLPLSHLERPPTDLPGYKNPGPLAAGGMALLCCSCCRALPGSG